VSARRQIEARFKVVQWSGDEALVACPHPDHDDSNPSAWINARKKVWVCFSCGRGGNLEQLMGERVADPRVEDVLSDLSKRLNAPEHIPTYPERWLDQFDVNGVHPYWLERGLSEAVCREFRLGYDFLSGRVTYPLRDPSGGVLGVVRRALDQRQPKYQYPAGVTISHTLFGYYQVRSGVKDVVITEGALDALALWDVSIPALAQMGASLSTTQISLLRELGPRSITFAYDQDQAGREALERVVTNRNLNFCPLLLMKWPANKGKDPLDLDPHLRQRYYERSELIWGGR